jgi:hypothetical protein
VITKRLGTTAPRTPNNNVAVPFSVSGSGLQLNQTLNGTGGFLSSPNFPGNYYHNLDYWVQLIGPERTRLVLQFQHLDLELQTECLYDFVELTSVGREGQSLSDAVRWCGNHQSETDRSVYGIDPCSSPPWTLLSLQNGKI